MHLKSFDWLSGHWKSTITSSRENMVDKNCLSILFLQSKIDNRFLVVVFNKTMFHHVGSAVGQNGRLITELLNFVFVIRWSSNFAP